MTRMLSPTWASLCSSCAASFVQRQRSCCTAGAGPCCDPDHDGLVHLVRGDHAGADLPPGALSALGGRRRRRLHRLVAHRLLLVGQGLGAAASASIRASAAASASETPFFSTTGLGLAGLRQHRRRPARWPGASRPRSGAATSSSVRIQAIWWRTSLIREGLSSWPVASWNRRLNSSSLLDSSWLSQLVVGRLTKLLDLEATATRPARHELRLDRKLLLAAASPRAPAAPPRPASSKSTRPGFTTATQNSGGPFLFASRPASS